MQKKTERLLLILVLSLYSLFAEAQGYNTFKDRFYWGGNLGLSFGEYTYIQVAPVGYYAVTDDFKVGLGLDYTYYKDKANPGYIIEGSIFSPRVFARYFFYEDVFIHGEILQIFYKDLYGYSPLPNAWISERRFYAGGGYRSWMSEKSYSFFAILFDLERSDITIGVNPILRFGFAVGI